MRLNYNQFLAVVYGDLFDWPLTKEEFQEWVIAGDEKNKVGEIGNKDGFYFLHGRERLIKLRKQREKFSQEKFQKAKKATDLLAKIGAVEGIFLTGSVAVGNAKKDADIDLLIICSLNTVWLTRLTTVLFLKAKGIYRQSLRASSASWRTAGLRNWGIAGNLLTHKNKVCPNIFLDTNNLKIKERNLYTAHEVLQAKCLFDRGGIEKKWLIENSWTKKYLPNAYQGQKAKIKMQNYNSKIKSFWLAPLELVTFISQYLYQKPKQTHEKVGWGHAFFHPKNLSERVVSRFNKRLAELKMTKWV